MVAKGDAERAIGVGYVVHRLAAAHIDPALRRFFEEHRDDCLRRTVAEQLAERLFVPGDAMGVDQRDEIGGGVARQRRLGEMRVRRQKAIGGGVDRSEEHTSELQSLMRISYAVFCLKKKNITT